MKTYTKLGERLTGDELRQMVKQQKTGHQTQGVSAVQRLWNGPPLVDPRTGNYYPACVICAPTNAQDGSRADPGPETIPAGLTTGGIVNIKAGTRDGGEFNRRVAVAGGRAYYMRGSLYHNVSVITERVNGSSNPIVFSWLTGMPAGRGDDFWEAPVYAEDGAGGKKFVPQGAAKVWVDTPTTFTWGIFVDGTERVIAGIPAAVGERIDVPPSASYFATADACNVWFLLAPL